MVATWPWLALILLGAWHGLNPGMGWLFSVALGLQQRSRRAVFTALLPIALGHALAIGLVVLLIRHSRSRDPVPMAPDWRCNNTICHRDLETLACATPHLGRYVCQFLGSDHLVMADGKRTWSRAHGRAGTPRREIDVLWSNSIQHKLAALLSAPDCHRCSRRSHELSSSHRWTGCLDSL